MITVKINTTRREEFVDITQQIQQQIPMGFDGICIVYTPHTTSGLTINEHADPSVVSDMIGHLRKLVPYQDGFDHAEGNSDAHIKASLMGSSVTVVVENGSLKLGTWQGIFFCEFDGPRRRKTYIKLIGS